MRPDSLPNSLLHALPRREQAKRSTRPNEAWNAHLPAEWRDMAIVPLDFVEHREYEIAARRCFGYDVDGGACYYAHGYALDESRTDDDEDFYRVVAYSETVHAWRLRDDRWLIHRIVRHGGESTPGRAFYAFSEHCPR